jgi:periplasmic copper chaperone A
MGKYLIAAVVAAWCSQAGDLWAHSHKQKGLEIVHPWCSATSDPSIKSTAVYMLIKNRTRKLDRLIGATSTSAQKIELREPAKAAPGAETRIVASVAVKAGQEVALKRTGPHLVLSGLAKPLAPYDSFLMTLIFQRAGKIEIEVVVEEAEPAKQ